MDFDLDRLGFGFSRRGGCRTGLPSEDEEADLSLRDRLGLGGGEFDRLPFRSRPPEGRGAGRFSGDEADRLRCFCNLFFDDGLSGDGLSDSFFCFRLGGVVWTRFFGEGEASLYDDSELSSRF